MGAFRRGQALRGFVVDSYDHVAGPDSGLICRSAHVGSHHNRVIPAGNDRHAHTVVSAADFLAILGPLARIEEIGVRIDRKSTRLNSSHITISYAVFCLKKK